jgi:hypothetical protein
MINIPEAVYVTDSPVQIEVSPGETDNWANELTEIRMIPRRVAILFIQQLFRVNSQIYLLNAYGQKQMSK